MKILIAILIGFFTFAGIAQDKLSFGVELAPSFKLTTYRIKTTGIRSSQSGFGFTAGVPVKYLLNDYTSLNTGLNYEFTSFDSYTNGFYVGSLRFNAIQLPIIFNYHLTGNWYAMGGAGVNYNFMVRSIIPGVALDVSKLTTNVQPYLGIGANNLKELNNGALEIGLLAKYYVLDIYNKSYPATATTASHLVSLDLFFRIYF